MKLSISLPDSMAREIKKVADQSERGVSWWIQRAWDLARGSLLQREDTRMASHRRFMKTMASLRGVLKKDFPGVDSVTLAHQALRKTR